VSARRFDPEAFSSLVGAIYDTALEAERWPEALRGICDYIGGVAAVLFWQDAALKVGGQFYSWGDDPHYTRLYLETYIKLTPCADFHHFSEVGEVKAFSDLFPLPDLCRTRFYTEWMQPQGYIDNLFGNLDKSLTSQAAIRVVRHERDGPIDGEMRRRMSLLMPHVRRAVLIGRIVDSRKVEAAVLTAAFERLATAVFLVDGRGRIVFANGAGAALVEEGKALRAPGSMLSAVDRRAREELAKAFAAAGIGDAAVGVDGIAVSLPAPCDDGAPDPYVAHVLPLTDSARQGVGAHHAASAAVFVRKTSLNVTAPAERLAKLFKLTVGELRVLQSVVRDGSVSGAADTLGIAESTVRTHLHNLFQKTNTSRQADLVKLVAAFLGPLDG
jgi:DNA-binding CsgD family transcriptional regulator/PAS domain-containing protein